MINEADFPYSQRSSAVEPLVQETARQLGAALDSLIAADETRPVLVVCHVPLHYSTRYNGLDNTYAQLLFDELNRAAETLNLFFLYGHNHSGATADYEADWGGAVNLVVKGQILDVNRSGHGNTANPQRLNFTYLNAGYTGYSNSVVNSTRTLSLLRIYDSRVEIARYDAAGEYTRVESLGQTDPRDPQAGPTQSYPISVARYLPSGLTVQGRSADPLHGAVTSDGTTVTAVPEAYYEIGGWSLSPADAAQVTQAGNTFYFSDVTESCTLTVQFTEATCVSEAFSDVDQRLWYHEGVDFALANSLFLGLSSREFAPEAAMTRAMLVTVLYRLDGAPVIAPIQSFTDVEPNCWYGQAVTWAAVTGAVNGMGDGIFAPEGNISREQIAVILYRYSVRNSLPEGPTGDLSAFRDRDSISGYAMEAMTWAVGCGLMEGINDGRLAPQEGATRAQVATLLMRYCRLLREAGLY